MDSGFAARSQVYAGRASLPARRPGMTRNQNFTCGACSSSLRCSTPTSKNSLGVNPSGAASSTESTAPSTYFVGKKVWRPSVMSWPRPPKLEPRVEAVIPLLHVPDDPGPDPAPDLDPEPEPTGGSRGLRLFK